MNGCLRQIRSFPDFSSFAIFNCVLDHQLMEFIKYKLCVCNSSPPTPLL